MIKQLFVLAIIFSLASCAGKQKSITEEDGFQIEEGTQYDPSQEESYEAIEDEAGATALNEETQAEEEEVEVQDRVFFGYDSSQISSTAKGILDVQASWLKSDPSVSITVEGHCDEKGTREYNIALGEKRAAATKKYLVSQGVDSSRIRIVSYGKERPAYFGSDEATISKNRRAVTLVN